MNPFLLPNFQYPIPNPKHPNPLLHPQPHSLLSVSVHFCPLLSGVFVLCLSVVCWAFVRRVGGLGSGWDGLMRKVLCEMKLQHSPILLPFPNQRTPPVPSPNTLPVFLPLPTSSNNKGQKQSHTQIQKKNSPRKKRGLRQIAKLAIYENNTTGQPPSRPQLLVNPLLLEFHQENKRSSEDARPPQWRGAS